ncbi:MAG: 60S ribosomal protein L22 [Promethearchaeota archaeon]
MSKATTEPESAKTFITIEIKDMLNHGGELGTALVNFLSDKLAKDVTVTASDTEVYVRSDSANHPSKTQLRTYLKRFLHLNALRDDLKLISRSKDRFVIIEFVTVVYVEE